MKINTNGDTVIIEKTELIDKKIKFCVTDDKILIETYGIYWVEK